MRIKLSEENSSICRREAQNATEEIGSLLAQLSTPSVQSDITIDLERLVGSAQSLAELINSLVRAIPDSIELADGKIQLTQERQEFLLTKISDLKFLEGDSTSAKSQNGLRRSSLARRIGFALTDTPSYLDGQKVGENMVVGQLLLLPADVFSRRIRGESIETLKLLREHLQKLGIRLGSGLSLEEQRLLNESGYSTHRQQ